eukprot:scaffold55068_cov33-Tisochrysis_lutea.AAC.1
MTSAPAVENGMVQHLMPAAGVRCRRGTRAHPGVNPFTLHSWLVKYKRIFRTLLYESSEGREEKAPTPPIRLLPMIGRRRTHGRPRSSASSREGTPPGPLRETPRSH